MTVSANERKAAIERVLGRLAELCGDERRIRFGEEDLDGTSPLRTTIDELEERGLVKQVVMSSSPAPYLLTVEGWFEAKRVSGHFESEEFRRRRGRVCAAMKRAVDDRRDVALIGWETPGYMPRPPGELPRLALHDFALTMLGIHLLDRADFDALSEVAAAQGRWEFMLTLAPMPIPNGTGSPVNPIAIF